MYLLNNELIKKYVTGEVRGYLTIGNFSPKSLHSTYYYFRLGHSYSIEETDCPPERASEEKHYKLSDQSAVLTLEKGQYARVVSLERFALSERIMGIFGPISTLAGLGVDMQHSPFLDPLFEGNLQLVLYNRLGTPCPIPLGTAIGKISFFDVSDTYPIRTSEQPGVVNKLAARDKFRDGIDDVPPFEGDEPHTDWKTHY